MSDSLKLVLLQTGYAVPLVQNECGTFPTLFRQGLDLANVDYELDVIEIQHAAPERIPACDGVIVSGSPSMIAENTDWMQRSKKLMSHVLDDDVPLLGVCFGHQLLGSILGADVGPNAKGRAIGTIDVDRLVDAELEDSFFKDLPTSFAAQVSHVDVIREIGDHLVVVGKSSHDGCHMVRAKSSLAWGVQFHPEFTKEVSLRYLRTRREVLDAEQGEGTAARKADELRSSHDGGHQTLAAFLRWVAAHA
ncbi:MAG: hypothetical protein GY822_13185 [Deltaproteobacteria bacterium]|nr:hypothetical protein [Deltaproteobacteria bacterium]